MSIERLEITDRAQWLDLRRRDVTASDIGTVCGVNQYKTIFQLWAEKTGASVVTTQAENGAMRRGRWYEKAVAEAAKDCTDWLSLTPLENKVYLRDPDARIGATPDAIGTDAAGEFIVQLKTVSPHAYESWDGPPLAYQLQTLTEAMLWDADRAFLAVLITDNYNPEFKAWPIDRNPAAETRIRDFVGQFWADIDAGRMPEPNYDRDAELIREIFKPRADLPQIDLSDENHLPIMLEEREALKAAIKESTERVSAIDAELIHKLAGHPIGICGGWKLTNKMQDRAEYTVAAKSFPVLRISKPKDKPE